MIDEWFQFLNFIVENIQKPQKLNPSQVVPEKIGKATNDSQMIGVELVCPLCAQIASFNVLKPVNDGRFSRLPPLLCQAGSCSPPSEQNSLLFPTLFFFWLVASFLCFCDTLPVLFRLVPSPSHLRLCPITSVLTTTRFSQKGLTDLGPSFFFPQPTGPT